MIEKPFGHDLDSASELNGGAPRGARRGPDLPDRPFPRQGAGDGHHLPPLRELDARADLEPALRRLRPDHDGARTSGSRAAAASTTRSAPCATSSRTTCSSCSRWSRWSRRPGAPTPTRSATEARPVQGDPARRIPKPLRPRPVRGLPRGRGRRPELAHRDLRRRCGSRSRTGAGPASPSSSAPGKCMAEKVTEMRVILQSPPPIGIGGGPTPEADELDPPDRSRPRRLPSAGGEAAGRGRAAPGPPGPPLRAAVRRPARPLRAAAQRRPGRQPSSSSRGRTWSRRPGGSCSR